MFAPFSRITLFLVACCGWGVLFFGGWIAGRGLLLYDWDPVLMGTGGGLAIGGLLVVGLTIGASAQVSTARDTAAVRRLMESGATVAPATAGLRAVPTLRRDPPMGRGVS
ncbi:hypothetical protein [Jannaschia pohangensis]|uniref:Uncharacterized protein n=1 Tax=Jannaschia pohangensis TaxID=390807 RepID=A0A1I3SQZ3_9RHOB|nr:hypothetical protein [Jannaschia pohangensis]SFJ60602.1 hypothetical protein SAMN04488095_3230 [Jannaschia pohangensis]